MGSDAEAVVREARVPVLLVHSRERAKRHGSRPVEPTARRARTTPSSRAHPQSVRTVD
jgi:hypothetical protein